MPRARPAGPRASTAASSQARVPAPTSSRPARWPGSRSPIASRVRVSRSVAPPPPEAAPMHKTLFDKLWDAHIVSPERDSAPALRYADLHLIHEVHSPKAFRELNPRSPQEHRIETTGVNKR